MEQGRSSVGAIIAYLAKNGKNQTDLFYAPNGVLFCVLLRHCFFAPNLVYCIHQYQLAGLPRPVVWFATILSHGGKNAKIAQSVSSVFPHS
jgi:hypothetical protein